MSDFFRFPHTPHLAWLGKDRPRDDKILSASEADAFLGESLVLEEKIDGANLGISVGPDGALRAQNRGQYLQHPYRGQFSRLNDWIARHELKLIDALGRRLILFGEWAAAIHSLAYERLPDFFLVFDVYDRMQERFWSTTRRNALTGQLGLTPVPKLGSGHFSLPKLKQQLLCSQSAYRQGSCEGIYLRREDADWLAARAKLVHPEFAQGIGQHWRSHALRWNMLRESESTPNTVLSTLILADHDARWITTPPA